MRPLRPRLGDLLVEQGAIAAEDVATALGRQASTRQRLGDSLLESGAISESQLVRALAAQVGLEFVELSHRVLDPSALSRVPLSLCRRSTLVPVGVDPRGRLLVAMADPGDVVALDDVRAASGLDVRPLVATRPDVLAAIERAQEAAGPGASSTSDAAVSQAPVVRRVDELIAGAVAAGASDIHVEPGESDVRVRYRIDGVLQEVARLPTMMQSSVVSRLKVMADIDIAERRRPQDGRLTQRVQGRDVDLRVATLPTVWGEKVVLRVLDRQSTVLDLAALGFSTVNLERFEASCRRPHGMVLLTGPTGSGKSTTLYATLGTVSTPGVNVITVEDPVEYRLPGVSQVQVNPKAGLTFASALRSILRSDPDVVLVGEVRDAETAVIAVQAALTGHLVLSTLHTNDAPSAVVRLAEMGVEPFLVGSALECVVAQRLARRLCARCSEPVRPDRRELLGAGFPLGEDEEVPELRQAVGCPACSGTGYRGRLAVHEVMTVTEEIERLAVAGASAAQVRRAAVAQGMVGLREDGWSKVRSGLTTVEEVLRVVA